MSIDKKDAGIDFGLDIPFTTNSNSLGDDLLSLSSAPQGEPFADFNALSPNGNDMLSDLNSVEAVPLDGTVSQSEDAEEQETFDVGGFLSRYDIMHLPLEFDAYFKNSRETFADILFNKSTIDDLEQDTKVYDQNGIEDIKFDSDDQIIDYMFKFLTADVLLKRITAVKNHYYKYMMALHHHSVSGSKVLDLPVINITKKTNSAKTELSDTTSPKTFVQDLEALNLKEEFLSYMGEIDWTDIGKQPIEKIIQLLGSSDNKELQSLYKTLESHKLIAKKTPPPSYTIKNKLEI